MNQTQALNPAVFQALAQEETVAVDNFLDVLRREQAALVQGQVDQLPALAEEKNGYCLTLDRFSRRRQQLLAAAGLNASPANLAAWVQAQPDPIRRTWQGLLSKAEEARSLNRQNGEIITSRMQTNQQSLTVLLEISNRAAVYGPDGQPRPVGRGRILGSC